MNRLIALLLVIGSAAGQGELVVEGRVPAAVPDGSEVVARIVTDAGATTRPSLASAAAAEGRFELTLPATVDPALLEVERLGCDDEELLELAYLPFLLVEQDGEVVGRLLLTDMPRELWRHGTPARHAYFLYAAEEFTARGECGPGEIAVAFERGWNAVLVIADADGMTFSDQEAPESFRWHFEPR